MYKVGDVVKSTAKYSSIGTDEKCRWFVFLGQLNFTESPRNIYLCTTTTQIKKYEQNKNSTWVEFEASKTCFDCDCILCLDELETAFTEQQFNDKFKPELKGRISDEKLKEIARKIRSADLSKKVIQDILDSFRKDEISTR